MDTLSGTMIATALASQLLQVAVALALAPLLIGWVNQCRAWLANRRAPSILLPYRTIHKLFSKDAVTGWPKPKAAWSSG